MSINVLCTQEQSVYDQLDCITWPASKDAYKFKGSGAIVAHPPCRAWGRYHNVSKHTEREKGLAPFCLDLVRKNGGVLEHPLSSKLWKLLKPDEKIFSVDQLWFGHLAQKKTGLFIVGCPLNKLPQYPLVFKQPEREIEQMSRLQREQTPVAFATWLITIARKSSSY